jgi:hypothetical protein
MKTPVPTLLIIFSLTSFAFFPKAQAVSPPPDGGYPGGNTAEGQNALLSLTTGTYNTALGLYSVLSLSDGKFNTGVGAGTLLANTADENTATGAGALLSNATGVANTANGAFALFSMPPEPATRQPVFRRSSTTAPMTTPPTDIKHSWKTPPGPAIRRPARKRS